MAKEQSYYPNEGSNTTPHNNQLAQYKFFYGESFRENRQWRLISLISLSAFFIALGICLYAINLPRMVPIVITVSDEGETRYIGNASKYSYANLVIPEQAIQYQVRKFITYLYSVSSDADVINAHIREFNSMLVPNAATKLNIMLKENSPYKDFGSTKKSPYIESLLQLSAKTYQVDFIVTTTTMSGQLLQRSRLRSVISIDTFEPQNDDKEINPLGIYITDFDITLVKEL